MKTAWPGLTEDELGNVDGNSEKLYGLMQEKYGITGGQTSIAWGCNNLPAGNITPAGPSPDPHHPAFSTAVNWFTIPRSPWQIICG